MVLDGIAVAWKMPRWVLAVLLLQPMQTTAVDEGNVVAGGNGGVPGVTDEQGADYQ